MANEQNLKPFTKDNPPSKEMAKKNGRKGGIKKAENDKLRKSFAELGKAMLDSPAIPSELESIREQFPDLGDDEITNRAVMLRMQIFRAITTGDTKSFEILRDTIGEKPIDKIQTDNISEVKNTVVITDKELAEEKKKMKEELTSG